MHTPATLVVVSAIKGRRRRESDDKPKVLIQAWLEPEHRAKVRLAADSAGISIARYLAALIERDEVDQHGCPVWLPPVTPTDQEELPLNKTA